MIKPIYELFKPNLEFNNDVKEHLSQYPYLRYAIKETDLNIIITFNQDLTKDYVIGIMNPYKIKFISQKIPVQIEITGKKDISSYSEYKNKPIIGNIEKINIEELDIYNIVCKVDTGATTSSMNVTNIKIDGKSVSFTPLDKDSKLWKGKRFTKKIEENVRVQSSNGEQEVRPLIKLTVEIASKEIETFFSLADRKELEYEILLGKDLLSHFLIDPAHIKK